MRRLPRRVLASAGFLLTAVVAASLPRGDAAACPAEPNVVFLVDVSGSMANVVWHPAFDPLVPVACNDFASQLQIYHDETQFHCGTTRTYHVDPALEARGIPTRFAPAYLNWLHDLPDGHPYLAEIEAPDSSVLPACLGGGSYPAYWDSRMSAAQRFAEDVVCRVTSAGNPRLGLARPRTGSDPAGGYLAVPVDDDTPAHVAALDAAIANLEPLGWGPLAESLFHTYTYAMSRGSGQQAVGADGFTLFPPYIYDTSANPGAVAPPSPVQADCQEQIAVVLADDAPTRDDFDTGTPGAEGFVTFPWLIGNYNPDDAYPEAGNEEPDSIPTCTGCEVAFYLDDVAMFMHDADFRPDLAGVQRIRTYTVGFARDPVGMALLAKTAVAGGGLFLLPEDAAVLADEILAAASPPPASVPALGGPGRLVVALLLAVAGLIAGRGSRLRRR